MKNSESNFNNISGCSWILGVDIVLFKSVWIDFDPGGDRWPAEYGRFCLIPVRVKPVGVVWNHHNIK